MTEGKKTAIVTGGARGIGRAIACRLADSGMNIVINYAGNAQAAEEAAELCRAKGVEVLVVQGDVSNSSDCDNLIAKAKETFGSVDVLVNNAGITRDGLILSMKDEDFAAVLETNLIGTFYCSRAAAKVMLRQRSGRIINMSSVVGVHGNAGQTNYSASKGGVISFTKSLARELASRGITVNAIAPGYIDTEMTRAISDAAKEAVLSQIPMGHIGETEDIAATVDFLASEGARYITGQVIGVDGGMGM